MISQLSSFHMGHHVNNTWIQLFEEGKAQRSFARKHVGSDILTVPVQSHIDARSAKSEIADHDLVQKVRHDRIAEPDLISLVGQLEAEAGR